MSAKIQDRPSFNLKRWLPLIGLAALMALAFAMGWHKYLSFKTVGLNYDALQSYINANFLISIGLFFLIYTASVSLSLPVASFMTPAAGLLFGWQFGTAVAVLSATIGATVIFLIVRSSFGTALSKQAGPFLARLRDGFQENQLSYMLFLRLVPLFPFFIVNIAPGLLGVRLSTFMIGTGLGIIPGGLAYALAGSGLGSVIDAQNATYKTCLAANPGASDAACPYSINVAELVTPELIAAGVALAVVALIPIAVKKWSTRNATS